MSIKRYLAQGTRGDDVKALQMQLTAAGYGVIEDGIFGKLTHEALVTFQREHGLFPDGIVGPKTMAALTAPENQPTMTKSRRTITDIIVHCTATPEGKAFTVQDIRRWHTTPVYEGGRGWSDIGYHYVVCLDGSVQNGRDVNIIGAHCSGHNSHSIGVVYVGGCAADGKTPMDTRTPVQKTALIQLLKQLRQLYPKARIVGHRDYDQHGKACPSFDAKTEYKDI